MQDDAELQQLRQENRAQEAQQLKARGPPCFIPRHANPDPFAATKAPGRTAGLLCPFNEPVHGAVQALSAAFAADDLEAALDTAMRLRYTERIREAIEKRLPS